MSTIVCKIDVTKIDKARLFKGKKGTYLDIVLIETPDNEYGDSHMIVQGVSQDERKAGVKGAILGNAKTLGARSDTRDDDGDNGRRSTGSKPAAKPAMDEDVPF